MKKIFNEVIIMLKKLIGALLVGAFVFGLGAACVEFASQADTQDLAWEEGSKYDQRRG